MNSNVKSDVIMFADDTAIIAHDTHLANAVSQIVDDVDRLSDWFCFNKLTLNLDKTKCMYFSKSVYEENESIEVNIKGVRLELVTKFSYLGIVIDSKLQFNDYIKKQH